jgi:hypothetical protein
VAHHLSPGKDPTTDFRGMGLLGLHQLHFLCMNYTDQARQLLFVSNHPRRFYPLAATSINISSFVVQCLLRDCRLHSILVSRCLGNEAVINNTYSYDKGPASSSVLVDCGLRVIDEIYVEVFLAFSELWEERDPQDIMQFQPIFTEVQQKFRAKYLSL